MDIASVEAPAKGATIHGNRKVKRGKLRSITIRPADNGHVVEVDHHPHYTSPHELPPHQTSVHTDPADALAHVGKAMGHDCSVEEEGE